MNSLLPQDIVIKNIEEVNEDFHPVTSAQEKTYCYTILNRPLPSVFDSETSTHVTFTLNDKAIYEAASYLEGEHNFRSFCTDPETKKHHVRCIKSITVRRDKDFLLIHVTGNGFLYNMVRIIVGTLIEVGRGRIGPEIIPDILASRDRDHAGPTAAPQGLCLVDVIY
jgi:tRNA pseudouridine38-40 synthase